MTTFTFDPKCHELAEHFLGVDAPERALNELAQAIQNTVEDYAGGDELPNDVWRHAATPFADNH
jgi:hypothetical protein